MGKDGKITYEVDESLENGPVTKRGCNDIICMMLFIANIIAVIAIGIYGY